MMKRPEYKIIKMTYAGGNEWYYVKVKVFPFIWMWLMNFALTFEKGFASSHSTQHRAEEAFEDYWQHKVKRKIIGRTVMK